MSGDDPSAKIVDSAGGKTFELFAMPLVRGAARVLARRAVTALLLAGSAIAWSAPLSSANQFVLDHALLICVLGLVLFAGGMVSLFASRRLAAGGAVVRAPAAPAPVAKTEEAGQRLTLRAEMVRSAALTGKDGGLHVEIEIKMTPGDRPVEVQWLRFEWHDGANNFSDKTLAENSNAPLGVRSHFLLERPGARRVSFSIPPRWRAGGAGRVVAMVGTEEVPSNWFEMRAGR